MCTYDDNHKNIAGKQGLVLLLPACRGDEVEPFLNLSARRYRYQLTSEISFYSTPIYLYYPAVQVDFSRVSL